jgi:hypothetical protein
MRLEEFSPHLNRTFVAECTPADVQLRLVEAYPLKDRGGTDRPPFILIFHSDPMTFLLDGIYVLRAEGFDPASIHIVLTGAAPGAAPGHYYQAVFN